MSPCGVRTCPCNSPVFRDKTLVIEDDEEEPLKHGCEDNWTWIQRQRAREVILCGKRNRTVHFHPNWSKGTAGAIGERVLNNGRYYWELHVSSRVFGTSIMFGIGTMRARLESTSFINMLGENNQGWGLSHKGVLWHDGIPMRYTKCFRENRATVIGILFDGIQGTLTYYKDGKCLGVAFNGLQKVKLPLYPIVCSTAAKTEMTLTTTRREFVNLQDRCRAVIVNHINRYHLRHYKLPTLIKRYLAEAYNDLAAVRIVDYCSYIDDF